MTDIGMVLDRLGRKLVTEVAPKLEGDYAAGHTAMAGLMSIMAGEAWDGAADRLVNEIAGIRALLVAGDCKVDIAPAGSFRISALSAERNALASHLIDLQRRLETADDAASAALNARIWGHYMQTTAARMPSPPVFPEAEAVD